MSLKRRGIVNGGPVSSWRAQKDVGGRPAEGGAGRASRPFVICGEPARPLEPAAWTTPDIRSASPRHPQREPLTSSAPVDYFPHSFFIRPIIALTPPSDGAVSTSGPFACSHCV